MRTWNFVAAMPERAIGSVATSTSRRPERLDRVADVRERQTEMEQRADGHVAADAGERIEHGDPHVATRNSDCAPDGAVVGLAFAQSSPCGGANLTRSENSYTSGVTSCSRKR